MMRVARLVAMLLALLAAAAPARALDPPDYETMLLGMDHRLATLQAGNGGLRQLGQAMWAYMEARAPQADEAARDAFLRNLESRLNAMSPAELDDLADRATRQNGATRQSQRFESAFHDKLDAVAFYTVASQAVMDDMTRRMAEIARSGEKPQDPRGHAWSRQNDGRFRAADGSTAWADVDERYLEFKRLDGMDWGNKKSFTKDTGLDLSESRWVDEFEQRLRRLYTDPPISASLARDLARAQYLMLTPKPAPSSDQLVVTDYLVGLADSLGDFPITPDELAQLPAALQRSFAAQATAEIEAKLRDREQDFDFRTTRLMPDGPLGEVEFLSLIAAGYVADDIGAGVEHGAATHRIQWYALTEFFENGGGDWLHTPAELYTALGEFDVERARFARGNRFEFERNTSLWAHLFDQQGGRGGAPTDISRPDFLRPILNGRPELTRLADRIEIIYRERQASGERLRAAFRNDEQLPFGLSPEERARVEALDAVEATATADELYMLGRYSAAERSGTYERVRDENGDPRPLLIQRGARLQATRDEAAIADTRRQWPDRLRGDEPRLIARDRPQRVVEHEAASTSDYRQRRRSQAGGESRPRREPLDREEPELPRGGEAVPKIDPTHMRARLVGEMVEEDPDEEFARRQQEKREDVDDEDELDDGGTNRDERQAERGRTEGRP